MIFDVLVLAFRRLSGRRHVGKVFRGKQITLDYQTFVDCRFIGCTLVLLGSRSVRLEGCRFENCGWAVAAFAGNTVEVLKDLSGEEGVAAVLRHTFGDALSPHEEQGEEERDPGAAEP